jgi:hypothetical protein
MQIGEVLPAKVKSDWADALAKQGTLVLKIEGVHHLQQIPSLLKERYSSYKLFAGILLANPLLTRLPQELIILTDRAAHALLCPHPARRSVSMAQKGKKPDKTNQQQEQRSSKPQKPSSDSNSKPDSKSQTKRSFGAFPKSGHRFHSLNKCRMFFGLDSKERQKQCKWSCIRCLLPSGCTSARTS